MRSWRNSIDVVGRCTTQRAACQFFSFNCNLPSARSLFSQRRFWPLILINQLDPCCASSRTCRDLRPRDYSEKLWCLPFHNQAVSIIHRLYTYFNIATARRSFASTSSRPADITLTVDGKEVTVPQGRNPWISLAVILLSWMLE